MNFTRRGNKSGRHRRGISARVFKGVMSADRKRTAYFLADLKTDKSWIEVRYDAMQPEEMRVGRWVDVGGYKELDYWMISLLMAAIRGMPTMIPRPAGFPDPDYQLNTSVSEAQNCRDSAPDGAAEIRASACCCSTWTRTCASVRQGRQGKNLVFQQARERKQRSQSYGDYVW